MIYPRFLYEEQYKANPLLILLNENFHHFVILYDIEEYDNHNYISELKKKVLDRSIESEKLESKSQQKT